ncbi:MAG: ferrous iron transport protein A [Lachnospiraceae bacterium]|nr:ferrous iron transport protein A [Lachnospiraceae bacterium]
MQKLSEMEKDSEGVITAVNGDTRFVSRITSIGLTPGCTVTVIKNEKNRPLLVYSRDTMIALNRSECENIEVEGGKRA